MQEKIKKRLKEIVLAASLTASLSLSSCSPYFVYKVAETRCEEPELYKMYKQIDIKNLTDAEKQHLKEMHQKYGEGRIKASEMSNELSEEWVKNFTYITGHKNFTDKDLVFINRSLPGIVGGIMINLDGKN